MRTRPLILLPLALAGLAFARCTATPALAPSTSASAAPTAAASSTTAPTAAASSATPTTRPSSSAPAKPVDVQIRIQWIPRDGTTTTAARGGVNLFVGGTGADTHTKETIPAEPAGTTPLTLRTQAKPGEKIQVIANVPQLPAAGDLHCEIIADGTTAPLDAQTGDPKGMPMVQCEATVPEPTS